MKRIDPVECGDGRILNALSFDIEDWFHLIEIEGLDDPATWPQRESIVEKYTDHVLETLAARDIKASFFIVGWIADRYPGLIRRIAEGGHELGTHSYWHRPVYSLTRAEFRADLRQSIVAIEDASGSKVIGYRAPSFSVIPGTEWVFDILHEFDVKYDASLFPASRGHGGYPCDRAPHMFEDSQVKRAMPELPMSVMDLFTSPVGFSGGGYLRAMPLWMIRRGFTQVNRAKRPAVVYLHPRDFAPDCPSVPMPAVRRFKSYTGLKTTTRKFNQLLDEFRFGTCGEVLRLQEAAPVALRQPRTTPIDVHAADAHTDTKVPAKPLKVLMLNQAFWPDVVATAQHADDLARYLQSHGDDVSVVASRALYGSTRATLDRRELRHGIKVYRVGMQVFGKRGVRSRAVDFTLFYLAALWQCLWLPKHDVVICFTTPPFIALVGALMKWIKGTRMVYWTMDLYPEVAGAAGLMRRDGIFWRMFRAIDRFCLRSADQVITLGRFMKERIIEKGADPSRVEMISVWSGAEKFPERARSQNPLRAEWGIGDRFTIMYVGNFGLGHDMEAIAAAVEQLKGDDSIRWVFVGDGQSKKTLEQRITACGATNVVVKGYQRREQLADVLDLGDTHLVSLLPGWEGLIVPSKFFSVLAAGKATLWIGPQESECVSIITENACGYQCEAGDGASLARSVKHLATHRDEAAAMGRRGKDIYEARYSSDHACKSWRDTLYAIARPARHPRTPQRSA